MTLLERAVANRTCQLIAGVVGLITFTISMGFLAASRAPIERISTRLEATAPSNLPILRSLNAGPSMRAGANVLTPKTNVEKRTARR